MAKIVKTIFFFLVNFLSSQTFVLAHEEEVAEAIKEAERFNLEAFLTTTSLAAIGIAGAFALFLVIFATFFKTENQTLKKFLFLGIAIPIILATLYLSGSTLYLNLASATKGPVHWHADFEIWVCGQKIDIVNPSGLSNRVGTPTFHEHGDDRIHVEGVVLKKEDVQLGNFFKFIGGELIEDHFEIPINEGVLKVTNGDQCREDQAGVVQVFVYQTKGNVFTQKKLDDFTSYIISPHPNVPPGDCLIIEFDTPREKTDKLCNFYKIAAEQGKINER